MRKRYITQEQLMEVKKIDLLTYLSNYEPNELVRLAKNDYVTKSHGSLHISNGLWSWWAKGIGGRTALDYLIKVEKIDFKDAALLIYDCIKKQPPIEVKQFEKKQVHHQLTLPESAENNDRLIEYLTKERYIDKEVVDYYLLLGYIYESKNHDIVFLGMDETDKPCFASIRATDSDLKKDLYGSDKRYSFSLRSEFSHVLHVFESVIDLMSYQTILKHKNINWKKDNYLSLGGATMVGSEIKDTTLPLALLHYLENNHQIKEIRVHTDNDQAGYDTYLKIKYHLENKYDIYDVRPQIVKDYNEAIQNLKFKFDIER